MTEEPRGWELQRALELQRQDIQAGFAQMNARLDKVVTQESFQREREVTQSSFRAVQEDIAAERVARVEAIKAERDLRIDGDRAQQSSIDKLFVWGRWLAATVLMPTTLFIANMLSNR